VVVVALICGVHPIVATFPPSEELLISLQGDGNAILEVLQKMLKKNQGVEVLTQIAGFPDDLQKLFDISHCKARALAQVGRFADSEYLLKRLIEDPYVDAEDRLSAQFTLAKIYIALRKFQEGFVLLQELLDNNPTHAEAWFHLGKIYVQRDQDYVRAKTNFETALQLQPNDDRFAFDYGLTLLQLQDVEGAHRAFELANNNSSIDRKYLIRIYLHLRRWDWLLSECSRAIASTDGTKLDEELYFMCADAEDRVGNFSRALSLYEQLLTVNSQHVLAHIGRASVLLGTGSGNLYGAKVACGLNQEDALAHLQSAIQIAERSDQALSPAVSEAVQFCRTEVLETARWQNFLFEDAKNSVLFHNNNSTWILIQTNDTADISGIHFSNRVDLPISVRSSENNDQVNNYHISTVNNDIELKVQETSDPTALASTTTPSFWERFIVKPLQQILSATAGRSDPTSSLATFPTSNSPRTTADSSTCDSTPIQSDNNVEKTRASKSRRSSSMTRQQRITAMQQEWKELLPIITAVPSIALAEDDINVAGSSNPSAASWVLPPRPAVVTNFQQRWAFPLHAEQSMRGENVRQWLSQLNRTLGQQFVRVSALGDADVVDFGTGVSRKLADSKQTSMLLQDYLSTLSNAATINNLNTSAGSSSRKTKKLPILYVHNLALHQYLGQSFLSQFAPPSASIKWPFQRHETSLYMSADALEGGDISQPLPDKKDPNASAVDVFFAQWVGQTHWVLSKMSDDQSETLRVILKPGETLYVPTGWSTQQRQFLPEEYRVQNAAQQDSDQDYDLTIVALNVALQYRFVR
jgi:tetratricopeptide (TPR) repeat protein